MLLAVIASKVVAALAHDARRDAGAQPPRTSYRKIMTK